jgi:hypothetical protein
MGLYNCGCPTLVALCATGWPRIKLQNCLSSTACHPERQVLPRRACPERARATEWDLCSFPRGRRTPGRSGYSRITVAVVAVGYSAESDCSASPVNFQSRSQSCRSTQIQNLFRNHSLFHWSHFAHSHSACPAVRIPGSAADSVSSAARPDPIPDRIQTASRYISFCD